MAEAGVNVGATESVYVSASTTVDVESIYLW